MIIIQGLQFKKEVSSSDASITFYDGTNKIILNQVTAELDKFYLIADSETTKNWVPSTYKFQVIDNNVLTEEGEALIKANLLYSTEVFSHWEKALIAIDQRLQGKTLDPANDVTVGDKRISYCSIEELLKLREFVSLKVDEEKRKEGSGTSNKNDEKKIFYVWR